ncbi:TraC family protein, partial [Escherichia coli]|uniref:TraC family protein n=1 Tax=Escherichia coli TaxID=562 RepID=UPI004044A674
NSTARILNFHLARNPEIAFLWNMADNYSNLLNPELSISCPFILPRTPVVDAQDTTHTQANPTDLDRGKTDKNSNSQKFTTQWKKGEEGGEKGGRGGPGGG